MATNQLANPEAEDVILSSVLFHPSLAFQIDLPSETLTPERAEQELARLVEAAPVARILTTAAS